MNMTREEVEKYLINLCETELVDLFYKAVSSKKQINGKDIDNAYCITNSGYYPHDGVHETEFLALPKGWTGFHENTSKEALFSGKCSQCKAVVACVEVEAICPICNNSVNCN
jgi:hypothetical protein